MIARHRYGSISGRLRPLSVHRRRSRRCGTSFVPTRSTTASKLCIRAKPRNPTKLAVISYA